MKLKFEDNLPEWILSSDDAAYHPFSKTIYIKRKMGLWKTVRCLCHEFVHYIADTFHIPELHDWIDGGKANLH